MMADKNEGKLAGMVPHEDTQIACQEDPPQHNEQCEVHDSQQTATDAGGENKSSILTAPVLNRAVSGRQMLATDYLTCTSGPATCASGPEIKVRDESAVNHELSEHSAGVRGAQTQCTVLHALDEARQIKQGYILLLQIGLRSALSEDIEREGRRLRDAVHAAEQAAINDISEIEVIRQEVRRADREPAE